jgi:HAD superfamily hydrolase (TIGR01509 family)
MTDLPARPARGAVRAVIFDLDGVLVDSEPSHLEADRRLLARYGVDFTEEMKRPYIGRSTSDVMTDLVARFGIPEPAHELVARGDAFYLEIVRGSVRVFAPSRSLLGLLHGAGYRLALASGSTPEVIAAVLESAGLRELFDVAISADSVARGKPAPDLFLTAAAELGVAPGACVVIEDSSHGVLAAVAAGMRCIAVPSVPVGPGSAPDPAYSQADILFEGGAEGMSAAAAFEWIRSRR